MDNIQAILDGLEAASPAMAHAVRSHIAQLASERDGAEARAREAEAKAHDLAVASAKARLEAQGVKAELYQPKPQQIMLRSDFDKLDPRQQMDAVKSGIRIVS